MKRSPALPAPRTDHYQVLGIARDAPDGAIRNAFVRLSRQHHPDHAGDLPHRLREVQQAYRCLSNATARAEHDHILKIEEGAHRRRQIAVLRRVSGYDRRQVTAASQVLRHRRRRLAVAFVIVLGLAALWQLPA